MGGEGGAEVEAAGRSRPSEGRGEVGVRGREK